MSAARPNPRDTRRRAMEQALKARREALRATLRGRKPQARVKKSRRRWWLLLVLLLLLLWLLRDCSEEEVPAPVTVPGPAVTGPVHEAPVVAPPVPLPTDQVARRARPPMDVAPPAPLPWIASFRSQVAARSPRLAECFVGAERPGRLKWTAAVEPTHGAVSDHTLEPTLQSDMLSREQRDCVVGVLSDPPYRLEPGEGRSTPSRVGMVIEF